MTTFHVVSQRVAPNANAASRCSRGTARSDSRDTETINGKVMKDKTMPAVRKPTPHAGPLNKGKKPSADFRNGSTYSRMRGTTVISASNPEMPLEVAAKSSTRNVSELDRRAGASSARKIAAPTPNGTDIRSARTEVTRSEEHTSELQSLR